MKTNTHNASCGNAQGMGCRCSGCGGALHGWQGAIQLATEPQTTRDDRRDRLEARIKGDPRTGVLNSNRHNRQTYIDLARLDVTEHLATTRPSTAIDPRWTPDAPDLDRMQLLGDTLLWDPWQDVKREIDQRSPSERSAREAKKDLAHHTWCGLLVWLIQTVEKLDDVAQLLTDKAKEFVRHRLTDHLSGFAKALADALVGIVVDRVWAGLTKLLSTYMPTPADLLRLLRMLALFACPSVEQHPEVYTHATKPLMGEAHGLVSEEVKAQVVTLFAAWWRHKSPETAA